MVVMNVFVVGDLRISKGYQKDFAGITKQTFIKSRDEAV